MVKNTQGGKMKKFILIIPTVLFPYVALFSMYCLSNDFIMEKFFQGRISMLMPSLILLWLVGFILTNTFMLRALKKKYDTKTLGKINMFIKLIHMPAYLVIFIMSIIFMVSIFTAGISVILLIIDIMTIILSGLVGLTTILRCRIDKTLNNKSTVLHSILQFVFCIDVISSIIVYGKTTQGDGSVVSNDN